MQDRTEPPTSQRAAAIAGLAFLAPALGGSTQVWAQAVVLLGIAALCTFSPPRRSAGPLWNLIFSAVMVLALTAFLPVRWFGVPHWRQALITEHRVELPATLSPQPWLSAEGACLLFAGLVFAY